MKSKLYTVKEMSEYMGVKPAKLYKMCSNKEVVHYQIGRLKKFRIEDIDKYLEDHKVSNIENDEMFNRNFPRIA